MKMWERADRFAQAVGQKQIAFGCGFVKAMSAADEETIYGTWMGGQDYQNASKLYGAYPKGYLDRVFALFGDAKRVLHLFSGSLTHQQVHFAWQKYGTNLTSGLQGPAQIRFDNAVHPASAAAKPDVIGNAETLVATLEACSQSRPDLWQHIRLPYDLILADPPYRLPDQRRYWREAMHALSGKCRRCHRSAAEHETFYVASSREGRLMCAPHVSVKEYLGEGYVRFKPLNKKLVIQQAASVLQPGGIMVWLDEIRPPYDNERWLFRGGVAILRSTQHRVRYATFLERR